MAKSLRLLIPFAFLLCCAPAFAAIAATSNQTCTQSSTSTLTCAASMTLSTNDAVVLNIGYPLASMTTASVADSCNNPWTHQTGASGTQSTAFAGDAWTTIVTSAGTQSCTITVSRNAGSVRFGWIAENYSGVGSIGNTATVSHVASSSATISLTTQDNNNVVVGVFGVTAGSETCTATSGTLHGQYSVAGPGTGCLTDNTAASPSSVTNAISLSGTTSAGVNGAIELRAAGSPGRSALDSDSGTLVVFNEGTNANYTLPSSPLTAFVRNKSNWNATVFALGSQTYKIVVQSPALLNGGSSSITVPQYTAIRLWSDGTNYYASNVPLTAGTGLTLTPSATGTTVAVNTSIVQTFANTVGINSDSSSITATTAGTATTIFTFPTLTANTNYSFVCEGTTTQATAGAGIGIAITAGTNAPTHLEAHATVATSATASAFSSSGDITSTSATAVYTGSAGTLTTQLPWKIS